MTTTGLSASDDKSDFKPFNTPFNISGSPLVNGPQATPSDVFEDIRQRFLDLDDGRNLTFALADNMDAQTWQSDDAIPSAFRIAIPRNSGNVICGQYEFGC